MLIGTNKGDKVTYGGVAMRVVSARDMNTLVVVNAQGEYYDAPLNELEAEAAGAPKKGIAVDTVRAAKVGAYAEALGPLLNKDRNTKEDVRAAGAKLGISLSATYDAIARFRQTGQTDQLPPPTRPGGRGKSRVNPKVEDIIQKTLEETILKRGGSKPRKFYREVKRRLAKAGLQVSQATLADRVTKIPEYRWTKARKGYNETRKTHDALIDNHPEVHRPLEVVQLDHWKADIEILSDDRLQVIGRVWITLAIDIHSRMVFGMHVGLDAPSTATFGMAMINGMTSKDVIAKQYGIEWDNPMRGRPERIDLDNAGEFTGESAKASAAHFHIGLKWRPIGQPQYGGHIERLNGNLAVRFKDLPGATGSSASERQQMRPEMTATFTLDDVTEHAWRLVDEYHNEVHTALGMTPLQKYKSYFFGPNGQKHRLPEVYIDNLQFRMHWFPLLKRSIQRYGIRIDHLDYYSESLSWLVRRRKDYKSVEIRRHPFDVTVIYVKHPDRKAENPDDEGEDHWFPVHVRQLGFPVASIYELRQAHREALRLKREPTPETLGKIIEEQHRHLEEAAKKTKSAQRDAAKRAHHDRIRSQAPVPSPSPTPMIEITSVVQKGLKPEKEVAPARAMRMPEEGHVASILAGISDDDVEAMFE